MKNIFVNYGNIWKHRKEYKNSRQQVLNDFEEWTKRVGVNPFHGGEEPDEADFEVSDKKLLALNKFLDVCHCKSKV